MKISPIQVRRRRLQEALTLLLQKGRLAVFAASLGTSVVFYTSCRSAQPLPAVDLSATGWRVEHGQAIWKPSRKDPELVGELLSATHPNGDFFIQFMKTPFALATAQCTADDWQIQFESGKYTRRGAGEPPARFVWFELPRLLSGSKPRGGWVFTRTNGQWRIEMPRTGERLEGRFFQ